ncbi:MAG: transglutaminase domain-containing protein [Bryobacteraceae bacterium]
MLFLLLASSLLAQHRQETISSARHEYTIRMGGSVDGAATRDPVIYSAWKQGYEPMRSVKLENLGDTDVVNPWILVNGKGNWRTAADIAAEAIRAYGDPAKMSGAEKARAIWEFLRRHRFHATTGDFEVRDPVKMLNSYGYALCGDNAAVLMDLWRAAGFPSRRGFPVGHCVAEVWYDGGWHLLDADEAIIFLERDNRTIASEQAAARDKDLSRRAYNNPSAPASLYNYDGTRSGDYPSHAAHRMDFTLRPGESIEWRWGQGTRHHYAPDPTLFLIKDSKLSRWGANAWATLRNGKWTYTPRLSQSGTQTWKMRTPYVMVGGNLKARAAGEVVFSWSADGETWTEAARGASVDVSLDAMFPSPGPARYEYFLRAEGARLESLAIENDLQMAPLAMPALSRGENRILYTDQTGGPRSVRLSFDWEEREMPVPPAPARAISPAAEAEGTRITFEWSAAAGASDYHFVLSDEPSLRWPLSPAFEVLQRSTSLTLPSAGLLNPGQRYYWRVRAKAEGVWGPWSPVWSFTPQAPGVPLRVRLEERGPGAFTLVWDANPEGRRPARFRIYGSDEKGFTPSDHPFQAVTGNQKTRGLFPGRKTVEFPASFIAETADPFYPLKPERAYYRVVAVDERGNRSGASEFIEAPRPWIYTEAPREARVGTTYRYEPKTIRSIGDLGFRDFGPDQAYQLAYWDADKPKFSLEPEMPRCGNFDPRWLSIDPETGVLSGTPPEAGEHQVNIRVEINGRTHVQSFPLVVKPVSR